MYEDFNIEEIIAPALLWYEKNRRTLPWRQGKNAYHTWVSEIMLQQTRVEAVKGYYDRFLKELPTIPDLAACPDDKLMKLWEGLGYYSRVRNLKKAAILICEEYGGKMPETFEEIIKLPGIGSYTAGAISSIAFGESQPAVDGNVLRILARLSMDDIDIKTELAKKRAYSLLKPVMPSGDDAGNFNQALMDIGATVCIPNGKPLCESCPWEEICMARRSDVETGTNDAREKYPVRSKGKPRRIEERTIIILRMDEKIMIAKRPPKGLLADMYEYPNLPGHLSEKDVREWSKDMGFEPTTVKPLTDAKHIFSHVEWWMKGYEVTVKNPNGLKAEGKHLAEELQWDLERRHGTAAKARRGKKQEIFFASPEEIRDIYAIPGAFDAYTTKITGNF